MKKLKWIVTGLVALVVAVVVAGYVVLSGLDFEDLRARIQAEAKAATGRDLVIGGKIDLAVSLTPAIAIEQVSFANADWGSRAEMVTLDRFEVEVALMPLFSGDIEIRRLVVVRPNILLETDAQGRANWSLEGIAETAEETVEEAGPAAQTTIGGMPILHEIVIEDGLLTYRDGQTGEVMEVALSRLTSSAKGPNQPISLNLEGTYNGAAIKLSGSLGAPVALNEGPFPVDLTAEAGGAIVTVAGVIAEPLTGGGIDLKISVRGESLAELGAVAGAVLPPLGPYDVSARLKMDGDPVSLTELAAKVGGSDLAGQATLALGGARPALSGALTSQLLDLDDFTPPSGTAGEAANQAEAGPGSPYVFTEDPLPLDGLKAVDADLKLNVATLRLQEKLALQDLDLTLRLAGGRLRLAPLTTRFAGGSLEANVDLDGAKEVPSLAASVIGTDIDYGQLLKDMELEDGVEGTLNLDIDLRGAGDSPRAIAAGLNGKTEIVSGEGVISNQLLKVAGVGLSDVLGPLMGGEEDAKLNCIVSRFDIERGLATSVAMIFDSEAFTVTGGGIVDLKTERLELHMDTATRETSIASLAVPFNIGGTLKSPSFTPDPIGTALGAAKIIGMFVAPPLAIGSLIAEKSVSDGVENACVAALEAAASGQAQEQKSTLDTVTEDPAEALESIGEDVGETLESLGEGLKNLFGN
jgi:uncharacterized protein involved in outer membrane biogenesis